ncbi:MAG: hypothetical protein JWO58_2166 [Chitinophagaceae bacterium]|nr:hypothetical protein [Chitinophagaceae bacterium]
MRNTFLLLASFLLLVACSKEDKKNDPLSSSPHSQKNNTSLSVKTNRNADVVDELYHELMEQKPELQELENQVEDIERAKEKAMDAYKQYNDKNATYYTHAEQRTNTINDSLLKNSIELLLKKSQYAYAHKNEELSKAMLALEKESISLHDHREALKIILSMNLIEKYQKHQQLPEYSPQYKQLIARYTQTVKTADSLLQVK